MFSLVSSRRTLIHCKCIYNFWCSMLVYCQLPYVLLVLLGVFMDFPVTNILTRCHSASSYFLLFLIPEKLQRKYSRNRQRKLFKLVLHQKTPEARRGAGGGPQGHHTSSFHHSFGSAWVHTNPCEGVLKASLCSLHSWIWRTILSASLWCMLHIAQFAQDQFGEVLLQVLFYEAWRLC